MVNDFSVNNDSQNRQSDSMKDFFLLFFHTVMSNEIHCTVVHQLKSSHLHSALFLLFRKLRKLKTNDKYK